MRAGTKALTGRVVAALCGGGVMGSFRSSRLAAAGPFRAAPEDDQHLGKACTGTLHGMPPSCGLLGTRSAFSSGSIDDDSSPTVTIPRERLEELLLSEVTQMATGAHNTVTMEMMIKMGQMRTSAALLTQAQFIHNELSVRFAVRTKEFERLPQWAREEPHMRHVHDLYMGSFRRLRLLPFPEDAEGERQLTELLRGVQSRHSNIVVSLALGMQELKRSGAMNTDLRVKQMNDFLSRNLRSRIGTVLLSSQHLSMQPEVAREGWVGNIHLHCCPATVIDQAVQDATHLCDRVYGNAPDVVVKSNLNGATFALFPAYIHYIAVELLKNGMRATMEKHGTDPPPVEVNIGSDGEGRLGIEVRDLGGGIPRDNAGKVWDWSFTTVSADDDDDSGDGGALSTVDSSHGLLAGLGFGLPLSRLHATYFGGDMQLISLPGLGTSAFLHVDTLGKFAEDIPEAYTRGMSFRYDMTHNSFEHTT